MWRNATEIIDDLYNGFDEVYSLSNDTSLLADSFRESSKVLYKLVEADESKYNISSYLTSLKDAGDPNSDKAIEAFYNIFFTLANAALKFFKISEPKASSKTNPFDTTTPSLPKDPSKVYSSQLHVYDLVFVYFFVAAGITLIMLSILITIAKKNKCAGDWAAIALRAVVGVGLALVAAVKGNLTFQEHYMYTPWMVPTVLLSLIVVVGADGVFGYVFAAPRAEVGHGHGHGEIKGVEEA